MRRSRATSAAVKKHALAISAGLGVILLVGVLIFLSDSGEQPAPDQTAIEAPEPTPDETGAEPNAEQVPAAPSVEPVQPAAAPPSEQRGSDPRPPAHDEPDKIGPVEELKAAYERDARDPEAGATEQRIRDVFQKQTDIPAELVRRVSCVKSACKIEVSWTSDRRQGYMIAMMSLIKFVSQQVAADPIRVDEGQEMHPIDVYVSRVVPAYAPADAK